MEILIGIAVVLGAVDLFCNRPALHVITAFALVALGAAL